jgi:hypothetical protein
MSELELLLAVFAINACVLGAVLWAAYALNKAVRPSGR